MLGILAGANQKDIDSHLEMGKKFLAAGQLADALSHYHAAVDLDPENYLTYFRRATVFLAIGKSKSALPDLEKVLQIKPDFHSVCSLLLYLYCLLTRCIGTAFIQIFCGSSPQQIKFFCIERFLNLKYNLVHANSLQ